MISIAMGGSSRRRSQRRSCIGSIAALLFAAAIDAAVLLQRDSAAPLLPDATIALVKQRLAEGATGSWENGTRAQALLEIDHPELSVFYNPCLPITDTSGIPEEVNAIAEYTIAHKPNNTLMLTEDGSAADPASLGVAVLLANATLANVDYMPDIDQQNEWLLVVAPRTVDGALSHRVSQVQLWSDFIYMVPPYLAYYGAMTTNASMIQAAYDQIRLYRNYLRGDTGLWRHIVLGDTASQDPGLWTTGNGWATMGTLRVLATMMHSPDMSEAMMAQKQDLQSWAVEILQNAYKSLNPATGLLPNYLQETTFEDAAGTALLAAGSYRLAQLGLDYSTLPQANVARQAVFASVDPTTGWVAPVVNERDWSAQGEHSPEAQSFVLMLQSAYRDYAASPNVQPESPTTTTSATATPSATQGSGAHRAMTSQPLCAIVLLVSLVLRAL